MKFLWTLKEAGASERRWSLASMTKQVLCISTCTPIVYYCILFMLLSAPHICHLSCLSPVSDRTFQQGRCQAGTHCQAQHLAQQHSVKTFPWVKSLLIIPVPEKCKEPSDNLNVHVIKAALFSFPFSQGKTFTAWHDSWWEGRILMPSLSTPSLRNV